MNMSIVIIIGVLITSVFGVVAILLFAPRQTKSQANLNKYARVNKTHVRYLNTPILRKEYSRILEMLSNLSIYNYQEQRYRAIQITRISTAALLVVWLGGTYIFRDAVSSVLLLLFALLVKRQYIDNNVDKTRRQVLNELSHTLASLREEYTRLNDIPEALASCDKGKLLQTHIEEIYNICTAVDGEDRLEEFYMKCQFRHLKTLAESCFILSDVGDDNQAIFKQNLDLIKDEVDLSVRNNTLIKLRFNNLEYMPIVPLFAIRIVQNFFMSSIPGTSVIYNGITGYISRLVIVLLALIGYYVITNINSEQFIRSNDRLTLVDKLLSQRWYSHIVKSVTAKKAKTRMALSKKIQHCLSQKDIEYVYGEKVLFSTLCFIGALIASVTMTLSARHFIYENTKSLSMTGGVVYSADEYDALYKYDCEVMSRRALETDDVMASQLIDVLPRATEFARLEEVDRIKLKYEKYHNTYYRWWYVLICYGVGVLGWFLPEMLLKFREFMVKSEAEEDVLQMQTVIASLMDTSLDTLSVLYWLEKNSTVHKDALCFCYHEYTSDPELALNRLKSKSVVPEFHHMCDNLLTTVHQISLKEAFTGLISERAHVMRIREVTQQKTIETKRGIASPLAKSPIYALALLYVILPIGILGIAQFTKAFAQAGF